MVFPSGLKLTEVQVPSEVFRGTARVAFKGNPLYCVKEVVALGVLSFTCD